MNKSEKQTEFFRLQLHVVIPRTYLYKLQLQFLSEESSHSPVSAVCYVCGYVEISALEVPLCPHKQFVPIKEQQVLRYDKVEPLQLSKRAIHGHPLRLNRGVQRFLGQALKLKSFVISPRNDNVGRKGMDIPRNDKGKPKGNEIRRTYVKNKNSPHVSRKTWGLY